MTSMPSTSEHQSFWRKLGGFFERTGYYVSEGFQKLFGADASKHFAVASLEVLKSDLGKIALEAVHEASLLAAGTDKRGAAFQKIGAAAKASGLEARDSLVNMLIELAVQSAKGAFGQKVI